MWKKREECCSYPCTHSSAQQTLQCYFISVPEHVFSWAVVLIVNKSDFAPVYFRLQIVFVSCWFLMVEDQQKCTYHINIYQMLNYCIYEHLKKVKLTTSIYSMNIIYCCWCWGHGFDTVFQLHCCTVSMYNFGCV